MLIRYLVLLLLLGGPVFAQAPRHAGSPVKVAGYFTNVRDNGQHAYGYTVELWKQGGKLYGLISASEGLSGDSPTGILENVHFNSKTKKFSFTAKLTLGRFFDKTHDDVDSQDIFQFAGTLTATRVTGRLTTANELCADRCVGKKRIALVRSKKMSSFLTDFKTLADWRADADDTLSLYGPKW